jgi:hypothetical protein
MDSFLTSGQRSFRIFLILISLVPFFSFQGIDEADEYTIKGMFIYNFTKYIDWSPKVNNNAFVIAIYGRSEITKSLQRIALTKKANNRTIEIKLVNNIEEAKDCEIVFIPRSNNQVLNETIEKLGSKGILIVTEDKNMATKGSCINIINVDGKIRFELNERAVKRDGLKVASQLEALAILIK